MTKKRVRVTLVVDLLVDERYTKKDIKEAIAVGKYEEGLFGQEIIHLRTGNFEVEEYVDIKVKESEKDE